MVAPWNIDQKTGRKSDGSISISSFRWQADRWFPLINENPVMMYSRLRLREVFQDMKYY